MIRPPRTKIDSSNKKELQFLDVLTLMDRAPVDVDNPWALLTNYVKKRKLKYEHLLSLARRYYDRDTIWQLGAVACKGVL